MFRRCSSDKSCPPPLKCETFNNGTAVSSSNFKVCQEIGCTNNYDCPYNWKCTNRQCVPKITCYGDADCGNSEVCYYCENFGAIVNPSAAPPRPNPS